eukprot:c26030_g1_i1 orf=679-1605(-)
MQDLLSRSFSSNSEERMPYGADLEAGKFTQMAGIVNTTKDLSGFFEEVGAIKTQMQSIKQLLHKLQDANEESKTITNTRAIKDLRLRMDKIIDEVLKYAKFIKGRLEELDRANIANRKIPGCEEGTSTDRTRISITNSLRKNLKDLMGDFQQLRQKMMLEYRETIDRRYYAVTGKQAGEEVIDHMIETGESETFLQTAIKEQGRGQIIDTIKEIQERHNTVKEIERNLLELHQIFLDMAVLVEAQGEELDNIEAAVQGAASFVQRGTQQLQSARKLQKNSRKWMCIGIIILLIVIIVILVPILTKVIK